MAETAAEDNTQPIQRKNLCVVVLKASIHCEGCKKKVKKILNQLPGVEDVDVDTRQQKVTVAGAVDADTLIKKLAKSGKHAQLWPQPENGKADKSITGKKAEKKKILSDHPSPPDSNPTEPTPSAKGVQSPAKSDSGESGDGTNTAKPTATDAPTTKVSSSTEVEETKHDGKEIDGGETPNAAEKKEKKAEATEQESSNGGGASGKKKKKKKGQSGNRSAASGAENQVPGPAQPPPAPANEILARHQPLYPYYTPPPVYAVSYNTANPTPTTSYYAPPYYASYGYMHADARPETHLPPLDLESNNPRQPLDSFEIFSDENPNGCIVM
ncbi:heavy metal-associated isoprenylated plant protein 35-like [Andrographis paniculata]|uniref:heavy metal-associated isoprenylated plant protein 35-like n=1 Tax=Andrographis paniculata TaxID=175694 RepID=UPI0021E772FA|nr:heavy metal-associated isoprenylated plant protein 35-like [Andrographis paniculata]